MKNKIALTLVLALFITAFVAYPASAAFMDMPETFSITKAQTAPVMDGVVTEDEWGTPLSVMDGAITTDADFEDLSDSSWVNIAYADTAPVIENLKGANISVYAKWDETNLYIAAVAKIPGFVQNQKLPTDGWKDYSMQFHFVDFDIAEGKSNTLYEFCFFTNEEGKMMQSKSQPQLKVTQYEFSVVKTDDTVVYEVTFPWAELNVKDGAVEWRDIGITYGFTVGNNAAPFAAVQFGRSLLTKNYLQTVKSVLAGEGEKPEETPAATATEAPAAETPTPTEAPAADTPTPTEPAQETEAPTEAADDTATKTPDAEDETSDGGNVALYIVIGAVVVAAIVGIIIVLRKKK